MKTTSLLFITTFYFGHMTRPSKWQPLCWSKDGHFEMFKRFYLSPECFVLFSWIFLQSAMLYQSFLSNYRYIFACIFLKNCLTKRNCGQVLCIFYQTAKKILCKQKLYWKTNLAAVSQLFDDALIIFINDTKTAQQFSLLLVKFRIF